MRPLTTVMSSFTGASGAMMGESFQSLPVPVGTQLFGFGPTPLPQNQMPKRLGNESPEASASP
ncbi:MAG: hypothetical protein QM820_56425 [Minicystis sp.]